MSPTFLLFTTRTQLLAEGYAWRDGTQSKKGLLHTAYGIPSRIKLGALYFDRNVVVGEGAQGKISIIEAVADGSFFYDKCLAKAHPNSEFDRWGDIFQEVEHLQEQGICKYFTQIIQPDLDNFLNYEVESHIVMENLGTDLKEQFQTRTELAQDIPDAVRFRIAIEVSFELAKLHGGLLSVKPKMHRDLKPGNVVLGPNGIRFIDFGMTEDDPDKMLYPDRGTPGYIENPAKDQSKKFYYQLERMFTLSIYEAVCDEFEQEEVPNIWCANKRSGRFFDLDALRRLLYTPLREHPHRVAPTQDSVLTEQLVQNYSLGGALERAYSTQDFQYQAEDALKIRDAMTFTAVLIAREVKLSDGQVDCIIADEHLAHAVVGSYFSEKDDWLLHGQAILAQLLTLAPQEMERRFHLVRAGLSHHLDEALQDQALCEVLGHPNHSSETKRIVAAAFQRGLWQGETTQICRRLEHFNSNSTLAHGCLDAHFRRCSEQFESDLLGMNVSYNKAHASSLRT